MKYLIIILTLLFSTTLFAQEVVNLPYEVKKENYGDNPIVRLICVEQNKVVQEHRGDGEYTDENLPEIYEGKSWKEMKLKDMPKHDYIEQLRCNGNAFTSDKNFKPDFVVKQESIEAKNAELDAELAKETPDPVKVIKLQRDKEKL